MFDITTITKERRFLAGDRSKEGSQSLRPKETPNDQVRSVVPNGWWKSIERRPINFSWEEGNQKNIKRPVTTLIVTMAQSIRTVQNLLRSIRLPTTGAPFRFCWIIQSPRRFYRPLLRWRIFMNRNPIEKQGFKAKWTFWPWPPATAIWEILQRRCLKPYSSTNIVYPEGWMNQYLNDFWTSWVLDFLEGF